MSIPTLVNGQITDSVTQSNAQVLGAAPAMALGSMYQSAAHAAGIMYLNSVQAQAQNAIAAQAAANLGVIQIYSLNSMAAASATAKVADSDVSTSILTALIALEIQKRL